MASRFWVGGSGTWDSTSTTHWSASSGGAGGASAPTNNDNVTFNGSSGGGTVTVSQASTPTCNNLTTTGFTGSFAFQASNSVGIYVQGTITIGSGTSFGTPSTGYALTLAGNGVNTTLTTNGIDLKAIRIANQAGIKTTLQDDLTVAGVFVLWGGTFDANGKNVTCASVANDSSPITRILTMGSGTWTLTGTGTVWDLSNTTGLTVTPNSSTIKLTNSASSAKDFNGGGLTFNNLWISGAGSGIFRIYGNNTFADFKVDTGLTVNFTLSTTQTITSLTASGGVGSLITLQHNSGAGFAWGLICASGTVSVDYCYIQGSHASGGAVFTARHSTDAGDNTGWNFGASSAQMLAIL